MKSREQHIEFDQNYCEHYSPQPGSLKTDYCALGLKADERMDAARKAGEPNMSPCIGGHKCTDVHALCPKWQRRSMERSIERADAIEQMLKRMEIAGEVVSKWRTWSRSNRVSKQEVIECPVCKGRLHLSQSSYNGHVHGKCETADCLNWME